MNRKTWVVVAVLLTVLAVPACAVSDWLEDLSLLGEQALRGQHVPTEVPVRTLPTLYPTLTLRPSTATSTEGTIPEEPVAVPTAVISPQDHTFRLELTEVELAALVGSEGLAQQGLQVQDLTVTVTEQNVMATFNAAHASSGLSGEITMIALPQVVAGELYLRVVDFNLGSGFSGFARLIATTLIQAALDNYGTANGIPIPISGAAEITSVELLPGRVVVSGVLQ